MAIVAPTDALYTVAGPFLFPLHHISLALAHHFPSPLDGVGRLQYPQHTGDRSQDCIHYIATSATNNTHTITIGHHFSLTHTNRSHLRYSLRNSRTSVVRYRPTSRDSIVQIVPPPPRRTLHTPQPLHCHNSSTRQYAYYHDVPQTGEEGREAGQLPC